MHARAPEIQGTAQTTVPAPAAPPIPPMPSTPGAPTGAVSERIVIDIPTPVVAGGQGSGSAGTIATTRPPDIPVDPQAIVREALQGAIPILGIVLSMVAFLTVGWPLARAYARRLDRRAEMGTLKAADVLPQIQQLQESVDAMAVELERISEAQRYQAKLMTERPPAVLPKHEGPKA